MIVPVPSSSVSLTPAEKGSTSVTVPRTMNSCPTSVAVSAPICFSTAMGTAWLSDTTSATEAGTSCGVSP